MKVLLTGGTGRIGANVAKAFLEEGDQVRRLVWPEDPYIQKLKGLDLELVYGDLRSYEDLSKAVRGVNAICHLGAAFQ